MSNRPLLFLAALSACLPICAAPVSTGFDIPYSLQIPGATLQPGHYTLSVEEDVLKDRAIVRLMSSNGALNLLLLTIPNRQLEGERHGPIVEWSAGNKHVLRGWVRAGSSAPLEFAYPKDEAVKLANDVDIRVLAIDPASQQLPPLPSMTKDDMKIIDLWLLSYSRATPDAEKKLSASKYQAPPAPQEYAANTAPAAPSAPAVQQQTHKTARLPHTASHTFEFSIAGLVMLASSFFVRALRFGLKDAR